MKFPKGGSLLVRRFYHSLFTCELVFGEIIPQMFAIAADGDLDPAVRLFAGDVFDCGSTEFEKCFCGFRFHNIR
jgi:hypothetical protein